MGNKMTLTFDDQTIDILRRRALVEGFFKPSIYARHLLWRGIQENSMASVEDEDHQTIRVAVNNFREIKAYVDEKQLGNINIFAAFAMKQYMTRYPLKTALKTRNGESTGD
jgi:hypothetical protein